MQYELYFHLNLNPFTMHHFLRISSVSFYLYNISNILICCDTLHMAIQQQQTHPQKNAGMFFTWALAHLWLLSSVNLPDNQRNGQDTENVTFVYEEISRQQCVSAHLHIEDLLVLASPCLSWSLFRHLIMLSSTGSDQALWHS